MLERLFHFREHNTTPWREVIGGAATFMAMSYIIMVQPAVLSDPNMATPMPHGGVFVATCVCSAFASILMGLWSNLPVALAPAMGHNFFFAFTVCGAAAMAWSWQEALAANFIAGVIFILLAATGLQEMLIKGIPASLKYAIAVGIGMFIAFIGLEWAGIVVDDPAAYVTIGNLGSPVALLALFGLLVGSIMIVYQVRGALLYGVLITAVAGLIASHFGAESWGYSLVSWKGGIVESPPDTGGTIGGVFAGFGALFRDNPISRWLTIIFIFLILDIFDTIGTLIGVAERAGLVRDDTIPKATQALLSDGIGTVAGTVMGTSTITSYVESAAGVSAGARTGLAPVATGVLFLAALFFYPLVDMVGGTVAVSPEVVGAPPVEGAVVLCHPVVAPVLILVGCYMLPAVAKIKWDDMTEALPAFLTIVIMQFAMSISHGIAWGFISYVVLKLVRGRARDLHPLVVLFAVLFVLFLTVD
jgi:AGZA family xanthine/uracil permease-like MFS transporter